MRVISGEFGGRFLNTLSSQTVRPTAGKVKEAIFNMIGPYFDGGRVLDLFSGSGSLAIEAVSRGMSEAILVEENRKAQDVIEKNIQMTKNELRFCLFRMSARRAVSKLTGKFDLIFLDPPYADTEIEKTILQLEKRFLLQDNALIVCETHRRNILPEEIASLDLWKQKQYGISKVTIYAKHNWPFYRDF